MTSSVTLLQTAQSLRKLVSEITFKRSLILIRKKMKKRLKRRLKDFRDRKLKPFIKDMMKRELSIASLNSDQNPYALKLFITACTLFVININYKIQALINTDAHDYAFIDSIAAHSLCKLFSILSILLIKSKLIQGLNREHSTSITHQILISLQIINYFKLFCLLLIITLD